MARGQATADIETTPSKRELIFDAFRRWGYLQADLDPLGDLQPVPMPELDLEGKDAAAARGFYCGTIGAEFMHIPDAERRRWIAQRMESETVAPDRERILERIVRAEIFEQVLQTRYLGTKRYSLEGDAALIPLLDSILDAASALGAEQGVVAMSHRGRLNVMVHTIGRAAADVFARFEDVDPRSVLGSGDVKYHLGATGVFVTPEGRHIGMHLVSNPSHLEAVDPVAMGRARAKQTRIGAEGHERVLPILLHGDAAFAGQGIWAETLNYAGIEGFTVGGSVHIIVNNLIGFTTVPSESHSSRFSSDLAKRLPIPIFHVNAEDPDAVVRVGRIAAEYRARFNSDVVVDLIGYRRHGHSEVDDPTITQPRLYEAIKNHPQLWKIYSEQAGIDAAPIAEAVKKEYEEAQRKAAKLTKIPHLRK